MSYLEDAATDTYRASLDLYMITDDTMTDTGVLVRDLQSIQDCSLTPGDPSPVGRTEDGDLAYPIHDLVSHVRLDRRVTAELAHLYARAHGFTKPPEFPIKDPRQMAFYELLTEAVPELLFEDSNHQKLAYAAALNAVIQGDWENYPTKFCRGSS